MAVDQTKSSTGGKTVSPSIKKVELSSVGSPEEIVDAITLQGRRLIPKIESACSGEPQDVFNAELPELRGILLTVASLTEILRLTGALQRLPHEVATIEKPTRQCEAIITTALQFPLKELGFQDWVTVRSALIELKGIIERFLELNLDLK